MNAQQGVTWDLTSYFASFNSEGMQRFKRQLKEAVAAAQACANELAPLSADNAHAWEALILDLEQIMTRLRHLSSYTSCLEAAHADVEAYALEQAQLTELTAEVEKITIRLQNAFRDADEDLFGGFLGRDALQEIAYYLQRQKTLARDRMTPEKEVLAADLNIDGIQAWGRLYNKISSKLAFSYETPTGGSETRPMSQWRGLISHPDREVGRQAFDGGNRAWQSIEDVCAAALNAISGSRLALYRHRGVAHFLDQALFQAGIERQTLEAMYQAIYAQIDTARDILRTKARYFNRAGIWFFEREAPLPIGTDAHFNWEEAVQQVAHAFEDRYPALASYFRQAIDQRWIESETRPGKRPGAFCTGSPLTGEQRVFMTFSGRLGDMSTLAHEVGHAWHSHVMRDMRVLARGYPMTLAETASIFAEHLLVEGVKADHTISDLQKFQMLDSELSSAAVLLLDITTRYEFETALYAARQKGEVPVSALRDLMVATQHKVYEDALLPDGGDPYFWASKLHFYITGVSFYNFPYTFGFLLARALIHTFEREGAAFFPRYEAFLRRSGSDSVENVIRQTLEADASSVEFWEDALQSLNAPLARYREAVDRFRRS